MTLRIPAAAPEWRSSALLTIDMQHDFADEEGRSYVPGTGDVVNNCRRLVEAFRAARQPVIHVVRLYHPDGSNAELGRKDLVRAKGPIAAPDTPGSEIVRALRLAPGHHLEAERLLAGELQELGDSEWAMFKPRWSAFFKTPLDGTLRNHGISTVVVAGCNLPNCPRATLFDASERDFRAVLVSDATSQADDRRLSDLELIDVHVVSTLDVLTQLGQPRL